MANEACDLLREIRDELKAIRVAIESRTLKRPASRKARLNTLMGEALMTTSEQHAVREVVRLWGELCPECPQPVAVDAHRRVSAVEFWKKMGGEDGVRNVFHLIQSNDWLSGRPIRSNGRTFSRKPNGVGLFEVITHLPEVIEQTYR